MTVAAFASLTGDVEAYVSRMGHTAGVKGVSGSMTSDPISIILAHELLGTQDFNYLVCQAVSRKQYNRKMITDEEEESRRDKHNDFRKSIYTCIDSY